MAETIFFMTKATASQPEKRVVDDIHAILINADSAQTLAQNNTTAIAAIAAVAGNPTLPDSYFDTQEDIGDLVTGDMATPGDMRLILKRSVQTL